MMSVNTTSQAVVILPLVRAYRITRSELDVLELVTNYCHIYTQIQHGESLDLD